MYLWVKSVSVESPATQVVVLAPVRGPRGPLGGMSSLGVLVHFVPLPVGSGPGLLPTMWTYWRRGL